MQVDGSVLNRKMRQGGVARAPLPDTRLIGDAFARDAEDRLRALMHEQVLARVGECRVARFGEAAEEIAAPAMIALLSLDGARVPAFLSLDAALAWHLVDLALGGGAAGGIPRPAPRAFTAVDLSICRLGLDALAGALSAALGAALGRPLPCAFAVAAQESSLAGVRLAPEGADMLKIRLELSLGDGERSGRIDLAVALATLDVIRAAVAREGAAAEARERPSDGWREAMRRAAAAAPVTLDAVLHRQRMSLATVSRLRPGDLIEIPSGAPGAIALTIAQPGGRTAVIAEARLGAYADNKVLRLRDEPEPRLAQHLRRALKPAVLAGPATPPRLPAPDPAQPGS